MQGCRIKNADALKHKPANAPANVKDFLKQEISYWIDKPEFEEGLYCHIERGHLQIKFLK